MKPRALEGMPATTRALRCLHGLASSSSAISSICVLAVSDNIAMSCTNTTPITLKLAARIHIKDQCNTIHIKDYKYYTGRRNYYQNNSPEIQSVTVTETSAGNG
eukprot:6432508-Amphidinium_carterae.1